MERQSALRKPLNLTSRWLALVRRSRPSPPFRPGGGLLPGRAISRVLILQSGPNASVDYYLRPRLRQSGLESQIADLNQDPKSVEMLTAPDVAVIICRYINRPWIEALRHARQRLSRIVYFVDDDLGAMLDDPSLPWKARGKVALGFERHRQTLEALVDEVWVSTPTLSARFPSGAQVVPPVPCDPPADPLERPPNRVVYHSTDVHGPERRFVLEIARVFQTIRPQVRFEITGDAQLQKLSSGLSNVDVVSQLSWPDYLAAQRGRSAAVFLAPITASRTNASRAPVKRFDAARLGACGVYADAEPYASAVLNGIDGLLVPMATSDWVSVISRLFESPDLRLRLARAARDRIAAQMIAATEFPFSDPAR